MIKDNGNLNVIADYGDTFNNVEFVKQASEELDAFAGTWTKDGDTYQYSFAFDGNGTLTLTSGKYPDSAYNNGTAEYTVEGNVATVADLIGYEWTFTLNDDGTITVGTRDSDGFSDFTGTITKQV